MSLLRVGESGFGWVVINEVRYDHDLVITADEQIIPRPKHLSKKYGGWHTVLGPEEIESALAGNPEKLLVGCGQLSQLPILGETRALLAQRGIPIEADKTQRILVRYSELVSQGKRVAAILHVTC